MGYDNVRGLELWEFPLRILCADSCEPVSEIVCPAWLTLRHDRDDHDRRDVKVTSTKIKTNCTMPIHSAIKVHQIHWVGPISSGYERAKRGRLRVMSYM